MEEVSHEKEADESIEQIWADWEKKKGKGGELGDGRVGSASTTGESVDEFELDCYPYTFSPLLLFCSGEYFDKGFSNYNSVAQFFSPVLNNVNMLENVLYERKNMLYEELLEYVTTHQMLVTCCIDAHFTAFQILPNESLLFYDPMQSSLSIVSDGYLKFITFMLLKCQYGNSQHIQDNEDEYYTGKKASPTRRMIYALWKDINKMDSFPYGVRKQKIEINIDKYVFVNSRNCPSHMTTQATGNTCYFQVFLFGMLCKIGMPAVEKRPNRVDLLDVKALENASVAICNYLLQFFVEESANMMRPMTNSNVLLDFYRHLDSEYFRRVTQYLEHQGIKPPKYDQQYKMLLKYFTSRKVLHRYSKFSLSGTMPSSPNTKSLQAVIGCDDAVSKLALSHYYKYRAANLMFGFNSLILHKLRGFSSFNALRKNQLLAFYDELCVIIKGNGDMGKQNKYRDYYFMPQYEIGQQELVDVHHYTYLIDLYALMKNSDDSLKSRIHAVNQCLVERIHFSTQRSSDYDKIMSKKDFVRSRKFYEFFLDSFFSLRFLEIFVGLGFSDINLKEKDINSLTQTVFYTTELMDRQHYRMEYDFEKECINQMARSTLRKYERVFCGGLDLDQKYSISLKIGFGFTYSKYNTLMHVLNVLDCYWHNPDLTSVHILGKDIRALLAVSCQKIFFESGHSFYHYGPIEHGRYSYYGSTSVDMDLAVSNSLEDVMPEVSREKRSPNALVITDRVFEYDHLKRILCGIFERMNGKKIKTDNTVLNLLLLSLMLDFGIYDKYSCLLQLPLLKSFEHGGGTKELQVEVSNWIHEFDKRNVSDSVTRLKVEELIFEVSHKFLVNKCFNVRSTEFALIKELSADPIYHQYVLLCKIYMSLCQINKSAEVDYYKVRCNSEFRIIIPESFSKSTSDYLDEITKRHTFSERDGFFEYAGHRIFDLRLPQPVIDLYKVRIDPPSSAQSMVKYIEVSNAFATSDDGSQFLVFIADNSLLVDVKSDGTVRVTINEIVVEVATIFFNKAISFVPCFKYADSEDVLIFTSKNIKYHVDNGGQFSPDYYGMRHELMECITSDEVFVDLNDDHVFKSFKISDLITESKTIIYYPDYVLQVQSRQQLFNLLDYAVHVRNLSFFILVLFQLVRSSVDISYIEKENKVRKISGPWKEAILYMLGKGHNTQHYDSIFESQFIDLNSHKDLPFPDFVDVLCDNFTRFQRHVDGAYQIVPTDKQKDFLQRIVKSEECFHFSEVGSGKTKVILPLLCQAFLSNNTEVHNHLARGGKRKHVLVVLVPEHLVPDAKAQIFRYCLSLNFRSDYRVYDDIFTLLHEQVQLQPLSRAQRIGAPSQAMKQIFITSFNQFKKALTYDSICSKVWPARENILCVVDEVDDFLDRDKLVFNICSNKSNAFDKPTLDRYFEVSKSVYQKGVFPKHSFESSENPYYWESLFEKCKAINLEIMDASRSINKSFGIFNEETLRHCSSNIAQDIEGYKSLIARPYESVNRAMPGSYYSDVERTIYLTFYILMEDIAKYDELFQQERKFISFEFYSENIHELIDFDELVYGDVKLSELVLKHPQIKEGLTRFLFEIILRRMEIRDKSRSVNSVDIVFNFDCIGFTGTPFIDNYPTFAYIRDGRSDKIPDLIDRSFYVHECEDLPPCSFDERFKMFQGNNCHVLVEYVNSNFISGTSDEMLVLRRICEREDSAHQSPLFNVIVDLCGIFKRSSVHDVRNTIVSHYGLEKFHYIYHIDQTDGSDRILCTDSDNDVALDEEFYKYLCQTYGENLREKIFFFVDNRNVIGKDIPFQLIYQRHFSQPLFTKSAVLAHDVDDFSKLWQAMGRSRTMNETLYSIYKSGVEAEFSGAQDIKKFAISKDLYISNCDRKMAGNLSSIYQTLISLCNCSAMRFYHCDEIVNPFLDKLRKTLEGKVSDHERQINRYVFGSDMSLRILTNIVADKFAISANKFISKLPITGELVQALVHHIVQQKFELREASSDIYDDMISFLSGEQNGVTEISYTKQQQKQKQKQQNKNQDSDAMEVFDKRRQIHVHFETENYFQYTLDSSSDMVKRALNFPIAEAIFKMSYTLKGKKHIISLFPTLMFLYSHNICSEYITSEVKEQIRWGTEKKFDERLFIEAVKEAVVAEDDDSQANELDFEVHLNHIRQCPQFTLAGIRKGVYVIGMKEQFNKFDIQSSPLFDHVQYVSDEAGFILYSRRGAGSVASVDSFGPYFIEQYMLMEVLSKQEVAQNVLDYYARRKSELEMGLQKYSEIQGEGFVCWRFLMSDSSVKDRQRRGQSPRKGSFGSVTIGPDLDELDA